MTKRQKIIIGVLAGILVVVLAATIGASVRLHSSINDRFEKPVMDASAVDGVPSETPEDGGYQMVELADQFDIGLCGNTAVNSSSEAEIFFTSSKSNDALMRVILFTQSGEELGSSGAIKPGQYVPAIKLDSVPEKSGPIIAKILSYDEKDFYSKGTANVQLNLKVD